MKHLFLFGVILTPFYLMGMKPGCRTEHRVGTPINMGDNSQLHSVAESVRSTRAELHARPKIQHVPSFRLGIDQLACHWHNLQKAGDKQGLQAQYDQIKVKNRVTYQQKINLLEKILNHPVTAFLEKIRNGPFPEAFEAFYALRTECPFHKLVSTADPTERQVLEKARCDRIEQIGFDELDAARALFRTCYGAAVLFEDNPALVQSKPVEQKAEEPAIITSPIQSLKSRPPSPRSSGQDLKATTPSKVINFSPDVDARIEQRFAEIKQCETFEQCQEKVGAILESMKLSGELIPEQRRDLLVRGIKTYFKRLADPVGIVKDQLHSMMSVALVVCHISGFDEGHLDVAEILAQQQQMDAAFSGFSSENLSKITSEQWADLIATAAADLTFGMGVIKTVALLREIDAAGKAVGCIKLAKTLEERAVQSGIKLAKSVEDRLARAAVLGEEFVTCDGIVLHVPPELGEASVLKSGMQEGTKKLSACLPAEVARFEEIRSVVERLHPALHKNIDKIEELHQIIAKASGNVSKQKTGSLLRDINATKFQQLEELAGRFYESIRATTEDVIAISKNTGIPKNIIQRIKDHVFIEQHLLDGSQIGRFVVDLDMAASWRRLIDNKFVHSDLLLLQHELAEAFIMNGVEVSWRNAHDIVNKFYNWEISL